MAQDDDQSKKLKDIEERQNKYLARKAEEQDDNNAGRIAGQSGTEEQVNEDTEFSADHLCHECAPSGEV